MSEKKKMGRPKLDVPRTRQISLRFTEEEYERLSEYAKLQGLTVTQFVRKSAEEKLSSAP